MKLLKLSDNALFLTNWREKMRFSSSVSATIITALIVLLIFSTDYFNETHIYRSGSHDSGEYEIGSWLKKVFCHLAMFQGCILFFFGILSADKMAIRERSSGTLEFHRSSPTSRFNQYIGLLLGSCSLEWILFFGILLVSLIIVFITDISLLTFITFYVSLILTAIFYHTLAILLAISTSRKGILSHRRIGGVHLLIGVYIGAVFLYQFEFSAFYHLTWLPAYELLDFTINGSYWSDIRRFEAMHSFFGYPLPSLAIQIMSQIPLLALAIIGIMRKISHPDRPVLSKAQSSMGLLIILLLLVGSMYSVALRGGNWHDYDYYSQNFYNRAYLEIMMLFKGCIIILGMLGAFLATPTNLMYTQGLLRMKKFGKGHLNLSDDHNSNWLWLLTSCLIITFAFFLMVYLYPSGLLNKIFVLTILLAQFVFFASMLEYFRLSVHHKKMAFFATGMGILWILFPLFGTIIKEISVYSELNIFFMAFSPFWNNENFNDLLLSHHTFSFQDFRLLSLWGSNVGLSVVAILLAFRERRRCQKEILRA